MKLGNGGVAALQHFRIRLRGDGAQRLRAYLAGKLVHPLAPGPEVVLSLRRALFGAAGQRPLKGVAVRVAETRDDDARDVVSLRRGTADNDVSDAAGSDVEPDVFRPPLG